MSKKNKIKVTFFSRKVPLINDEINSTQGEFYLEKRTLGKWLCYKKGNLTHMIKLNKKGYKHLKRFTQGITTERYYDMDDEYNEENDYSQMYLNHYSAPKPPKEKANFIIEIFQYVSQRKNC